MKHEPMTEHNDAVVESIRMQTGEEPVSIRGPDAIVSGIEDDGYAEVVYRPEDVDAVITAGDKVHGDLPALWSVHATTKGDGRAVVHIECEE